MVWQYRIEQVITLITSLFKLLSVENNFVEHSSRQFGVNKAFGRAAHSRPSVRQ